MNQKPIVKTHHFTLTYEGDSPSSDETVNAIYDAGCDDASIDSHGSTNYASFDRESESLETAIQSAIDQLTSIGLKVVDIQIDVDQFTVAAS